MRRVLILSLVALGMFVVSCQKAEIVPNSGSTITAPEWGEEKSDDLTGKNQGNDEEGMVRITDPNSDPESNPNGDPNSGDH